MVKPEDDPRHINQIAEEVRKVCIRTMKEGFQDASMSGLCMDGAVEAAVGAVQSLNLEEIIQKAVEDS